MEIWKDIIGYERFYQVSNLGRFKSLVGINNRKIGLGYFTTEEEARDAYLKAKP